MREEKGLLDRQRDEWKAQLFRKPSRGRWAFAGLVGSVVIMFVGASGDAWMVPSPLPPVGILEGMGLLFGSLAEIMPEEQTTLAGILRLWAGLFVVCGFALVVAGRVTGSGF